MNINIKIAPLKTFKFLLLIIFFLLVAHFLYIITHFFYGYSYRAYFELFYLDAEGNVPTFFSSLFLSLAALLLFTTGYIKKRLQYKKYGYWYFLSILFALMAYDEASSMHENLNRVISVVIPDLPNFLSFGWVIPYFLLVVLIGFCSVSFLKSIPNRTAILFIISGAIFVTGAIGMELVGAYLWATERGHESLTYNFFATIEELMEMLGVVLFIYSILDYMVGIFGKEITIHFEDAFSAPNSVALHPAEEERLEGEILTPTVMIVKK